jgi:hypothetical protein
MRNSRHANCAEGMTASAASRSFCAVSSPSAQVWNAAVNRADGRIGKMRKIGAGEDGVAGVSIVPQPSAGP